MRSSPLKRRSGIKRKRRYRTPSEIEEANHRAFKEAAFNQLVCAVSGQGGAWEAHHVVEKQWLKRHFLQIDDPRNALRLNPDVHAGHTSGMRQVPVRCLTDDNIAYAFEVMGTSAYDYLTRKYDGTDERVERAFEAADAERLRKIEEGPKKRGYTQRDVRR